MTGIKTIKNENQKKSTGFLTSCPFLSLYHFFSFTLLLIFFSSSPHIHM